MYGVEVLYVDAAVCLHAVYEAVLDHPRKAKWCRDWKRVCYWMYLCVCVRVCMWDNVSVHVHVHTQAIDQIKSFRVSPNKRVDS